MTFTKERITNLLEFNSEGSDCQANAEQWEVHELARIALASLEAEPVCVIDQFNLDYLKSGSDADVWPASRTEMGDVLLYRAAPPAPVSVPEVVLKSLLPDVEKSEFWFEHDGKILFEGVKFNNAVFDACQAAMLQGADGNAPAHFRSRPAQSSLSPPQGGNSPVTPDCWVPCSERLPEETKEPDGGATGYLVLYAEGKEPNGGFNVGVWNVTYLRQWWRGFITHLMPLPAEPQQEAE